MSDLDKFREFFNDNLVPYRDWLNTYSGATYRVLSVVHDHFLFDLVTEGFVAVRSTSGQTTKKRLESDPVPQPDATIPVVDGAVTQRGMVDARVKVALPESMKKKG